MAASAAPRRWLRKRLWTDWMAWSGPRAPEDRWRVCLERQGSLGSEALANLCVQATVALGLPETDRVTWALVYADVGFELRWKDRAKAYGLVDFLLHAGVNLLVQPRMSVWVRAADLAPGDTCTPEWLERYRVRQVRAQVAEAVAPGGYDEGNYARAIEGVCSSFVHVYAHAAAWRTEEGRALVAWLLECQGNRRYPLDADSSDEEVWTDTEPAAAGAASSSVETAPSCTVVISSNKRPNPESVRAPSPPAKRARPGPSDVEEEEDADAVTCCICLDRPADTLVLPCMHSVVCRVCSQQLRATRDAHTCVQCRRPIASVLQDGAEPVLL